MPAFPSFFILLAILNSFTVSADGSCADGIIQVESKSDEGVEKTYYGGPAVFGPLPSKTLKEYVPLKLAKPIDACKSLDAAGLPGSIVLAIRGNCTFLEKALNVQNAGGLGLLVYNNDSRDSAFCPSADETAPHFKDVTISTTSLSLESGQALGKLGEGGVVKMSYLARHNFLSGLLLWMIAVGTVIGGSVWSGVDHVNWKQRARRTASNTLSSTSPEAQAEEAASSVVVITEKMAITFVVLASVMLLVLFFLLSKSVYIILLVLFTVAGSESLAIVLAAILTSSVGKLRDAYVNVWCCGALPTAQVIMMPFAVGVCVVWALGRNMPGFWILQNIIGVCLILLAIRILRIPTLKVGSILLSLFLLYDVFWVFIQPLFTPENKSVMVEVATSKGMDEVMPMVFRVPGIWGSTMQPYSILGYGDIMIPGILVAYTRRLDVDLNKGLAGGYFLYEVVAYGVGLLLTYVAQVMKVGGGHGQPALLYLVPCTLGMVFTLACIRGEFWLLMNMKQKGGEDDRGSDVEQDDAGETDGLLTRNV